MSNHTDAELLAAIDRAVELGDMVAVTPELLADWADDTDPAVDGDAEGADPVTWASLDGGSLGAFVGDVLRYRVQMIPRRDGRTRFSVSPAAHVGRRYWIDDAQDAIDTAHAEAARWAVAYAA